MKAASSRQRPLGFDILCGLFLEVPHFQLWVELSEVTFTPAPNNETAHAIFAVYKLCFNFILGFNSLSLC